MIDTAARLEPVGAEHVEALQGAVASVARERRFLVSLEGFSIAETRAFVQSILNGWGIQYVAMAGRTLVGWCDVRRSPWPGFEHTGVLGIGVIAPWRGRGVGSRLLGTVLEACGDAALTRVELEVFASNAAAIRLYERFGFVTEGIKREARVLDGRVDDLVCMARLTHPRRAGGRGLATET